MKQLVSPQTAVTVAIDKPLNNAHVPGGGTFKTFGFVTPTGATMSAWITDGGNTYNGTATNPPPHSPSYDWGFQFTGIPTGHAVSLTVQGVSGSDTGSQTISITCDA
ncbi:MAG: hypothetical protein K2R98_26240 [Gemmataceae bacterium]|nr:hypothetical protein [Gemmataceae bacterium]